MVLLGEVHFLYWDNEINYVKTATKKDNVNSDYECKIKRGDMLMKNINNAISIERPSTLNGDSIDKILRNETNNINIGDEVRIIDEGALYITYESFFEENDLKEYLGKYAYGEIYPKNRVFTIVGKGKHKLWDREILVIQNTIGQIFLIDKNGVEKENKMAMSKNNYKLNRDFDLNILSKHGYKSISEPIYYKVLEYDGVNTFEIIINPYSVEGSTVIINAETAIDLNVLLDEIDLLKELRCIV